MSAPPTLKVEAGLSFQLFDGATALLTPGELALIARVGLGREEVKFNAGSFQAPGGEVSFGYGDGKRQVTDVQVSLHLVGSPPAVFALFDRFVLDAALRAATSVQLQYASASYWRALLGGGKSIQLVTQPALSPALGEMVMQVQLKPKFPAWTSSQAETPSAYDSATKLLPRVYTYS